MLELADVHTYYWDRHVLWGVTLEVPQGSVVALQGRNGMGKTTMIRSIMGLTPPAEGSILFEKRSITGLQPHQIARVGIGLVPQGRCVFPSLTVKENLTVRARAAKGENAWNLDRIYALFPILKERERFHANLLSGGEQQMLAIARALMTNPRLLIMDEPSEGLAPLVVKQVGEVIIRLKGSLTVLLAEQNLNMALSVADHVHILSKGSIVYGGKPDDLRCDEETKHKWLGV